MYCLNCGNQMNPGEKFCPVCGEAAPADRAPIIENTPAESTQGSPVPEPQNVYGGNYYQNGGGAPTQYADTSNVYQPQQQQYGYQPAAEQAYGQQQTYGQQQFAPYGQGTVVKKKSKKPLVITLCCVGAAVIIALVVMLCMNIAHKGTLAGKLEGKWMTTYSGTSVSIEVKSDGTIDISDAVSALQSSSSSYSSYYNGFNYGQLVDSFVTVKYSVDDLKNLDISVGSNLLGGSDNSFYSYTLTWSESAKSSSSSYWYLSGDTLYVAGQKFTRVG